MEMRKFLSGILAFVMLCLSFGASMAGEGDRMIPLSSENAGDSSPSLNQALVAGGKLYLYMTEPNWGLEEVDVSTGERASWDMTELYENVMGFTSSGSAEEAAEYGEDERKALSVNGDAHGLFVWRNELFLLTSYTYNYGTEGSVLDGGHVRKIEMADGKAAMASEDVITLDWSGMRTNIGSQAYSRHVNGIVCSGDNLYLMTRDESGNMELNIFDLTTGYMTDQVIPQMNDIAAAPDGKVLISQYTGDRNELVFSVYDPDSGSQEELARFDVSEDQIANFAWNPESDTIYYSRNGEIYLAPNRDPAQAQAVNDCPASDKDFSIQTDNEQLIIWSSDGAWIRNTDPAKRSAVTLRIRPFVENSSLESVCNRFVSEHSDISIILENEGNESALLAGMMNHDSEADVFLISSASSAWSAVSNRGFTVDLSEKETLVAEVGKMYPWARDAAERDGKLAAVPLSIGGSAIGYSPEALKTLGMTKDDLPRSWDGFLDFLETLPEKLAGTGVRPFELYTYRGELQRLLVNLVLTQYGAEHDGEDFNTGALQKLLNRLQRLDYDALEVLTEEELSNSMADYQELGGDRRGLFSTGAGFEISEFNWSTPMIFSMEEGKDPMGPVTLTLAFINPYSAHPEEAALFLETLLQRLDTTARYELYPDLNEPVRYPDYEENRRSLAQWLEKAKESLETAIEGEMEEDIETWQEIVDAYEEALAYSDSSWMLSPEAITAYRDLAPYLRPKTWDFYSALSDSAEDYGQYNQLVDGFFEGISSSPELLAFIDRKVMMMRLEGD